MNRTEILNEVSRAITNELTTSLKKDVLVSLRDLKVFKREPLWLSSAITRHGPTPTLSTSDLRALKQELEAS